MNEQETRRAHARELLLGRAHLTGDELAQALPPGVTPAHLRRLRASGLIGLRFARRGYLYPAFQLDRFARRLDPAITRVNKALLAHVTPEEALMWWFEREPHPQVRDGAWPARAEQLALTARQVAEPGRAGESEVESGGVALP